MSKLNATRSALKEEARSLALKRASQEARLAKLQAVACIRNGFFFSWIRVLSQTSFCTVSGSLIFSVADPGSGAFFYPWIRDAGWVKNQDFPRA
jgi:hypothetical protein